MGLDFNAVKFLLWGKNLGVSFERTLTLGHQALLCSPRWMRRAWRDFGLAGTAETIDQCYRRPAMSGIFIDEFLRLLGAKEVVSVDRSDFEGATLLHDLNEPFPEHLRGTFDLVLDGGTLEHVFNFPQALRNCLELIRPGGHFVSISPADNCLGHGFYQFSPELFFRVLSSENGFALRKIVLFDALKTDADFLEVKDPALTGRRSHFASTKPIFIATLAQRISQTAVFSQTPQQSDYVATWESHQKESHKAKAESTPTNLIWRLRVALSPYWPYWLRHCKEVLQERWRHGSRASRSRRDFRRLTRKDISRERANALVS